jgi:hypothetical protein
MSYSGESVSTSGGVDVVVAAAAARDCGWNGASPAAAAIHPGNTVSFATASNIPTSTAATVDTQSVFSSVSKGNSLAFDVNSMSVACSKERPRKRQRLTEALQDFQFDHGVPDQIVPVRSLFELAACAASGGFKRTLTGDADTTISAIMRPPTPSHDVNSYKRLRIQDEIDDNSQLTASDVEDAGSIAMPGDDSIVSLTLKGTERDGQDDDIQDNETATGEIEKAQRKAMLDYVLGRSHQQAPGEPSGDVTPQNLVDRKIENLFRQSLQNVRKGTHPLQLKSGADDTDSFSTCQDDMAIDYSSIEDNTDILPMVPIARTPRRERSSSLPDSMDCFDTADYVYPASWKGSHTDHNATVPLPHPVVAMAANGLAALSDVDMDG